MFFSQFFSFQIKLLGGIIMRFLPQQKDKSLNNNSETKKVEFGQGRIF